MCGSSAFGSYGSGGRTYSPLAVWGASAATALERLAKRLDPAAIAAPNAKGAAFKNSRRSGMTITSFDELQSFAEGDGSFPGGGEGCQGEGGPRRPRSMSDSNRFASFFTNQSS